MNILRKLTLSSRMKGEIARLEQDIKLQEKNKYKYSRKPSDYVGALQEIRSMRAVKKALEDLL
jgi:hypothetical protein